MSDTPSFLWSLSSPGIELRREEREGFHQRIRVALRVGHGLGSSFALRFEGGASPGVTLRAESPSSARWIGRVIAPAATPSNWVPVSSRPTSGPPRALLKGRRGVPAEPRDPADPPRSWGDTILLGLPALAPGLELEWSFRPAAIRSGFRIAELGAATPTMDRPRGRLGEFRMSVRGPASHVPVPPSPGCWEARATISWEEIPTNSSQLGLSIRAINAMLEPAGGSGVRFPVGFWDRFRGSERFLLSDEEVASLFPSPSTVARPPGEQARVPRASLPLGRTDSGQVVSSPVESDQGRHLAILGETGMGKSSLLVALGQRAARSGTVVLLDPFGETARAYEATLGPQDRERLLRIYAGEGTARLNALEVVDPVPRSGWIGGGRRVFDLVSALRRVRAGRYGADGYWGPRLEEMLTRALAAAAACPGATLADAHTLLATGGRTSREVPAEAMALYRELAERIRTRPDDAEGARRLLYEVVRSQVLERLLCDPEPSLHPADLVAPGRIVLVSGDASDVGETNARYLLSVYLALVWSELIGRRSPSKTFLLLDEAQWFAHETLAEMFRVGRRRNVHLVLTTQAVAAFPEDVREALWTNTADLVAFRGSPTEARELERVTRKVSMEALLGLPRGRAIALIGKGHAIYSVRTSRVVGSPAESPPQAGAALPSSRGTSDPVAQAPPGPDNETQNPLSSLQERARRVRSALRSRLAGDSGTASFRVDLRQLREEALDSDGAAVRAVGRRLAEAGAIERTGKDEQGSFWILRKDRVEVPASREGPAAGDRVAGSWKPS